MLTATKSDLFQGEILSTAEIVDVARNGRVFMLIDDRGVDIAGHLIVPAQMATPDLIDFMAASGGGIVRLALTQQRIDQLGLLPLFEQPAGTHRHMATAVSIRAREGVSTGISGLDRARTISVAIDSSRGAETIAMPGHVFPAMARDGGILGRCGHAEAAIDVARLAGLNPSAVTCRIMRGGEPICHLDDLLDYAALHGIQVGTIRDLLSYRRMHDRSVAKCAESEFSSRRGGRWQLKVYRGSAGGPEHLALVKGEAGAARPALVAMHGIDLFAGLFDQAGGPAGTLAESMDIIGCAGSGVIVMIDQQPSGLLSRTFGGGPGIGAQRVLGWEDYGVGAQILGDLRIQEVDLIAGDRHSREALEDFGLTIPRCSALRQPGAGGIPRI